MKHIIGCAKSYWLQLVLILLSGLGCSVANVYIVDLLKQMIDLAVAGGLDVSLWMVAGKAVVVILVGMLANYLVVRMTGVFGAGLLRDMRRDLVAHMMKMAPNTMAGQNFGDLMERMSSDVSTIAGYMQTYFKDCLYVPIVVVVFAVYLFSMNPLLAVVCLGPLVVMVPLSIKLLNPVKMAQKEYVKKLGLTNNPIQEAFDGADVIKSYNLQAKMQSKYYGALKETLDISNKNDLWQYHIEPLSALIREAPTAIALCVGGFLALQGELSIGILVAFISGIKKINEPLMYAYQLVVRTQLAMISARRVFEILEMPVECENEESLEFQKVSGKVFEFQKIFFSYTKQSNSKSNGFQQDSFNSKTTNYETTNNILEYFDLSIEEGKKVALVGKSGSGKSTIMKLMCRQIEADDGEISFYGTPFSKMNPDIVRSQLALISQESVIFPMSVLDNIRMGRPETGREEIMEAAKYAGCHDFIMNLPEGYDTLLEEQGNNLSGGQRQRIAIARAILKDAPVILLDEPTSALDEETEKYVNETLLRISVNKTLITVAHRLNTIVDYDEILVLENGKVVESGTHEELMQAKGKYFHMYKEYQQGGADS